MLKLICLSFLLAMSCALDGNTVSEILENKNYTIDLNVPASGRTHLVRAVIRSTKYINMFFSGWFYTNPYVEIIKTLIEHGADPCLLTNETAYYNPTSRWMTTTEVYDYHTSVFGQTPAIAEMISCY